MIEPIVGRGVVRTQTADGSWHDIGFVGPLTTLSEPTGDEVDPVSLVSALRSHGIEVRTADFRDIGILLGIDPARRDERDQRYAVAIIHHITPGPPRKRRGLTGKAYRIARRRYARQRRQGTLPRIHVNTTTYATPEDVVVMPDGSHSIGFRAVL